MIGFWVLAITLVASAIFTISQKSPVYSVIGLLLNFLALAATYFTLDAEFLGVIQVVVYGGAILMLFVFVLALLSTGIGNFSEGPNRLPNVALPAILLVAVAFGLTLYGVARAPIGNLPAHAATSTLGDAGTADVFGSVGDFGKVLFTTHLLPFEVTALILMVAVIGVVLIAGDAPPQKTEGSHLPQRRAARERESIVKPRVKAGG